jgi:two-component system, OmpR family, phosphate regulon sensor histidine kinase PhoR
MEHLPGSPVPGPAGGGGSVPTSTTGDDERELLAAVFDASTGLALVATPDLRFVKVNPAYRALTPAPDVDPVGRRFEEVWPEAPIMRDALLAALRAREEFHGEDLPVRSGSGMRWFSCHARPVLHPPAPPLLVVVWETTAFVLSRLSAEAALDHALRRAAELDAVIDAIADGFVLYGLAGEVLRCNATAAALVEPGAADPRKTLASPAVWLSFEGAEGRPLAAKEVPVTRALAGETVTGLRLRVRAASGDRWILVGAAPVRGGDGRIVAAVVTFSDETAVHALEEARDDVVRMISHDLRTPLNAVYTQAHLLLRAPGDASKVTERARSIVRSCERMSAMIHDLVDTTLLEAGQLQLAPVPVDLATLVPDLIERLRGGLDVDRVAVRLAPGLPLIAADPPRVERILTNLLSNALKYSPGESSVTLDGDDAPGGFVCVTVSDRGVGIAPEDQAHLFERFFRARGARRPEGLGLGLYITRLLVEAHHGRIEVQSALGQGSTFRLYFPAAHAAEASGS